MAVKTYRYIFNPIPLEFRIGTNPGEGEILVKVSNGRIPFGKPGATLEAEITCDEADKDRADQEMQDKGWQFDQEV
jgi:hypothetical protein